MCREAGLNVGLGGFRFNSGDKKKPQKAFGTGIMNQDTSLWEPSKWGQNLEGQNRASEVDRETKESLQT